MLQGHLLGKINQKVINQVTVGRWVGLHESFVYAYRRGRLSRVTGTVSKRHDIFTVYDGANCKYGAWDAFILQKTVGHR